MIQRVCRFDWPQDVGETIAGHLGIGIPIDTPLSTGDHTPPASWPTNATEFQAVVIDPTFVAVGNTTSSG
jgi:hypothetical protein